MYFKRILIAVDDSPIAEKVCEFGFQMAKQMNSEIALISVVDTSFLITRGGVSPKEVADEIKIELQKHQKNIVSRIFKDSPIKTFTEEGSPYVTILRVAEEWEANILVIGTHGKTGLTHLLLGSVAERVIRHSKKPVLVIPAK